MVSKLRWRVSYYLSLGPRQLLSRALDVLSAHKLRMRSHLQSFTGHGLEIGGPSPLFTRQGMLPIYDVAARIDNVTYSNHTAWEGDVRTGLTFKFHESKPPGQQYVMEGADSGSLPAGSYDFVASCHMLEHAANPLAVLQAWKKILKPNGVLLLVLPHRDGTFDHRRPVTSIEHLKQDFADNVDEHDQTHCDEILALHDLRRDPGRHSARDFELFIRNNYVTRGAHHHVFDTRLAIEMLDAARFDLIEVEPAAPTHIFLLTTPTAPEVAANNGRFLTRDQALYRASPFKTDRLTGR
jgi:SAM-dependent methyltransferase